MAATLQIATLVATFFVDLAPRNNFRRRVAMSITVPQKIDQSLKASNRGRYVAIVGLCFMLAPIISYVFAFNAVSSGKAGFQDAEPGSSDEFGRRIEQSMMVSMWCFGAAALGAILVALAVAVLGNRELWVYRNGLFLGLVACLSYGAFGVIFGVGLIAILLIRRSEFLSGKFQSQTGNNASS